MSSTSEPPAEGTLLIRAADGTYYAIPESVMEQGRLPAERSAEIDALVAAGDVGGFGDGVLLPWRDAHYYALPPDVVERHRLSPEHAGEAAALLTAEAGDTRGFLHGDAGIAARVDRETFVPPDQRS